MEKSEKSTTKVKRTGIQVMAKLIGLVRPLIGFMCLAIILGVTGFLCAIFLNVFAAEALSNVLGFETGIAFRTLLTCMVVFGIIRGILHYGEQLCNHYIAFHILAIIRDKVFGALRRLAPAKLETKEKGNLISIITSDIELLEVFYAHTISPICIAIITSILMLVFFWHLHPLMCLIAAVGYLLIGLFMPYLTSNLGRNAGSEYRNEFGDFDSFFLDSLRGLREIIQFGRQKDRMDEIASRTKSLSEKQKKMKFYSGLSTAMTGGIVSAFSLIMLFTGVRLYGAGEVTYREVLVGTIAMMSSFGPVIALSGLANNLLHTFASGNRVLDLLEEEPVVREVTDGVSEVLDNAAEAGSEHLYFTYPDEAAAAYAAAGKADGTAALNAKETGDGMRPADEAVLRDMTLHAGKNQIIGIHGPSGCGKSTFLKLLMRFWDTDRGKALAAGRDVREWNTHTLRTLESFVAQDTELFQDTIENNIRIAKADATHEEIVAAAKAASLDSFVETLEKGYDTNVGELGDRLSDGEKQRIGIARAFLHDSPVLLLDEPTSNLDSLNEGVILKALDEKRNGKCVILVSHRKSTMGIADIVYTMQDGRAVPEE